MERASPAVRRSFEALLLQALVVTSGTIEYLKIDCMCILFQLFRVVYVLSLPVPRKLTTNRLKNQNIIAEVLKEVI